jgi:hypothetical protein
VRWVVEGAWVEVEVVGGAGINHVVSMESGMDRTDRKTERTWPAVSIMWQSYSTPLYTTLFANVDSMVG